MFAEGSLSTVLYVAILCLASSITLFAQSAATISRRVVDPKDAAAPLAKIRLFNIDTGGERFVSADWQGNTSPLDLQLSGLQFIDLGLRGSRSAPPPQHDLLSAPARGLGSAGSNFQISGITLSSQIKNTISLLPPISGIQKFKFDDSTFGAETTRRQFRFEAFDVLNHATFGQPRRAALGNSAFGQIGNTRFPTGDSRSSRQLQFALKFLF